MARVNYTFEKQQRAANKSRQQEEKRNKRHERRQNARHASATTEDLS
ncbi:hypothetical protein [Salinisphaera orenii]|uniref:Uncharacterized protein n=1 Tax=Salinisphaera orenii YIM 95161 TaxID=1051139 RepID=A0A423PDR4_9GAMM|nr:hypothetical protein [Salinisphaera halophila]ROO23159.1 hypothetical protein SAHL_16920 [Salinisphaera halophila YIM 95161]